MFVVDTNVLVYAVDGDSEYHAKCRALLESWQRSASGWYLTWGICYEFLRVTTHSRILRSPWNLAESWQFLEALLSSPSVELLIPSERHAEVAAEVFRETPELAGNLLHDATTAVLMREHGIHRIYTRDIDFSRFRFLEVIDPLGKRN